MYYILQNVQQPAPPHHFNNYTSTTTVTSSTTTERDFPPLPSALQSTTPLIYHCCLVWLLSWAMALPMTCLLLEIHPNLSLEYVVYCFYLISWYLDPPLMDVSLFLFFWDVVHLLALICFVVLFFSFQTVS